MKALYTVLLAALFAAGCGSVSQAINPAAPTLTQPGPLTASPAPTPTPTPEEC
jgi:PBP1b-binding outer membrane lipoprotein LpoB